MTRPGWLARRRTRRCSGGRARRRSRRAWGSRGPISDIDEVVVEPELTNIGPVDIDLERDQGRIGLRDDHVPLVAQDHRHALPARAGTLGGVSKVVTVFTALAIVACAPPASRPAPPARP